MNAQPTDELTASILEFLKEHKSGLTLQELEDGLSAANATLPSGRTLRRSLRRMADRGLIEISGNTRNRRYSLPSQFTGEPESLQPETTIPLSADSRGLLAELRKSNVVRPPVGYNEQFLDEYVPGKTWYLPEATRTQLRALGKTADLSRPAGTFARQVYERLLIDLAWASSKLEGNTYSRLDTQNLLEHGIRADGKDAAEAVMLLNHKNAIALLVEQAEEIGFNRYTIFNLHAALSEGLLLDERDEGRLREKVVTIGASAYVPLSIPQKIEEHFDVILAKARDIPDAFEQSFFVMVHLPYLQPFIDVNKRTSRLAANISLIRQNLCPLTFVDVPEQAYVNGTLAIYELNRVEPLRDVFVWAYTRSCQRYTVVTKSVAEPDPVRLRYRQQINETVRAMVVEGQLPIRNLIEEKVVRLDVPTVESPAVTSIILQLLLNLHEGSTYRYGIRPGEFREWKQTLDQPR